MSTSEEAAKCIQHLHRTEMHGRSITVDRVNFQLCSFHRVRLTSLRIADMFCRFNLLCYAFDQDAELMIRFDQR